MNLDELKTIVLENKKYFLIYILFILALTFAMFGPKNYQYYGFEAISIPIVTIIGLITIIYSFKREIELHKVALVLIIVFGLMMVVLSPPMSHPDEFNHHTRAELMSEGSLYPQKTDQGYLVKDYFLGLNEAQKGLTIFSNPHSFDSITDNKGYAPQVTDSPFYSYIPSMLGILLAKCLNLTAVFAVFLSRFANLIFYAAVAYWTIKKIPKFKTGLTVIATMPLIIAQVSSTSYDAFILTFTLIILTYFIKMYEDKVENKDLAIFFISILLISLIKPPYILLSLLIFIIPRKNYVGNKNYPIIAIIALFIITFISYGNLLSPFFNQSISTAGNTSSSQITYILNNPLSIFTLIKHSITSVFNVFIFELSFFHYADFKGLKLFNLCYFIFFIAFSALYKQDINLSKRNRSILSIIFIITYFAIFLALYVIWTPTGSDVVLGIQARYFIPIIVFLPLIINYDAKSQENYKYLIMLIITFLVGLILLTITHYY